MTSLDECCLQTIRKTLFNGGAPDLLKTWVDVSRQHIGETKHGNLNDKLLREILGYAVVKYIHMHNGYVYGGFVASHFSGRVWNDIDICSPNCETKVLLKQLTVFLCFLFNIHNRDIEIVFRKKSTYGVSMTLVFFENIFICLDISSKIRVADFPISVGSCLKLTASGAHFREELCENIEVGCWKLNDLIGMLRSSLDFKIVPCLPWSQKHRVYYWSRILKRESEGWKFMKITKQEPLQPSTEELARGVPRLRERLATLRQRPA